MLLLQKAITTQLLNKFKLKTGMKIISGTVYPILEIAKAYFLKKHLLLEYYSPILKYHAAALMFHGLLLLAASEKYKITCNKTDMFRFN